MADKALTQAVRDLNRVFEKKMDAARENGADSGLRQAIAALNSVQAGKMAAAAKGENQ